MRTEKWEFPGAHGQILSGRFDMPDETPRAYALFVHCFACGQDTLPARRIAAGLAEHGIATLRFDFTGLGSSEGEFANPGFGSNVEDLRAAIAHMRISGRAPALLLGHSLGGAAAIAAADDPGLAAVAVIGAPFAASDLLDRFQKELAGEGATAIVTIAGRKFTLRREFVEELRRNDPAARISKLRKPLMVMHSPNDAVVPIRHARAIYDAARDPKSFLALDGADHLLSGPGDSQFVAEILAAWLPRYLPPQTTPEAPAPPKPIGRVVVEETRDGRFQQRIEAAGRVLIADEPVEAGGGGTGPNPYDLLLAALGACTSMTLRIYATYKGLPLERVRVVLDHRKIHAEDCRDCETRTGSVDEINRRIELTGALDAEARARFMEIADRCPVHRTLKSEIAIRTSELR